MVAMRVKVEGFDSLKRRLSGLNPKVQTAILSDGFETAAGAMQRNAKSKQIVGGGRGKGKALKALRGKLTSRTGTLRRSIAVNRGPLPRAIEVGTDLAYGAVHEFGGRVSFPASRVRAHTRSVAFGRKVKPFTVPAHKRSAYTANYPPRPFLKPAFEAVRPRIPGMFIAAWKKHGKI